MSKGNKPFMPKQRAQRHLPGPARHLKPEEKEHLAKLDHDIQLLRHALKANHGRNPKDGPEPGEAQIEDLIDSKDPPHVDRSVRIRRTLEHLEQERAALLASTRQKSTESSAHRAHEHRVENRRRRSEEQHGIENKTSWFRLNTH